MNVPIQGAPHKNASIYVYKPTSIIAILVNKLSFVHDKHKYKVAWKLRFTFCSSQVLDVYITLKIFKQKQFRAATRPTC